MAKRKKDELKGEKNVLKNPNFESSSDSENQNNETIPNADMADENINPLLGSPIIERDYAGAGAFEVNGDVIDSVEEPPQKKIHVDMNKDSSDAENEEYGDDDEVYSDEEGYEDYGNEENGGDGYYEQDSEERAERAERSSRRENVSGKVDDDFANLDSKTQNILSGNFANTMVDAYKMLLGVGGNLAKKSKEQYQSKAIQGKFDMRILDYRVPMGDGMMVRYGDFVTNYNNVIDEVMVLDKDKEKEMKELTKRVAKKHGVGMSDEMTLGLMVGGDLMVKATLLIQQYRMMSNVEAFVMKQFQQQSGLGVVSSQPSQMSQPSQAKKETKSNETASDKKGNDSANQNEPKPTPIPVPTMNIYETKEKGEGE